jgi:adenosylhomocysteine nucleosidase
MNRLLGLVVPLQAEIRSLLGRGTGLTALGRKAGRSRLRDGTMLLCVRSGVGIKNAYAAAAWLVSKGVNALSIFGIAGGLAPGIQAGDLVIGERVVEEPGGPKGRAWGVNARYGKLVYSALEAEGIDVRMGTVVTVREPILAVEKKKLLYARTKALAVDMESAAVAKAAAESNLSFFVLRAICDPSDREVPFDFFSCLDQGGKICYSILLKRLWCRPSLVGELLQVRRDFTAALGSLKRGWQVQIEKNLPGLLASWKPDV